MGIDDELRKQMARDKRVLGIATVTDDIFRPMAASEAVRMASLSEKLFVAPSVMADAKRLTSAVAAMDLNTTALGSAEQMATQIRQSVGQDFLKQISASTQDNHKIFASRYALPKIDTISAILAAQNSSVAKGLIASSHRSWDSGLADLTTSIGRMTQPWLDVQNHAASIGSFSELQKLGSSLKALPPFGKDLSSILHADLGDWRESDYKVETLLNSDRRNAFYVEHGFNSSLTELPDIGFYDATLQVGLRDYSEEVEFDQTQEVLFPASYDDSEQRFDRALLMIARFEKHVRRFIDQKMTEKYGARWTKTNVLEDISKRWGKKHQEALDKNLTAHALFEYADFTDYIEIIIRNDNWDAVFAQHFITKDSIKDSMRRLYPVRNAVMHSRNISKEDEIYLLVVAHQIFRAIGVPVTLMGNIKLIVPT